MTGLFVKLTIERGKKKDYRQMSRFLAKKLDTGGSADSRPFRGRREENGGETMVSVVLRFSREISKTKNHKLFNFALDM
jgi:hypothetical protein